MSSTIKFVEVYNRSGNGTIRDYGLRTIYLNPDHIVSLVEDTRYAGLLSEGSLPADLDPRQSFTNITLTTNGGATVTVVGLISDVHERLYNNNKTLLRG